MFHLNPVIRQSAVISISVCLFFLVCPLEYLNKTSVDADKMHCYDCKIFHYAAILW